MTATLRIENLVGQYRVSVDHPDPQAVKARLDAALRELPALMEPIDDGDAVWCLEDVDVELVVDAALDPHAIASALADQLARAIHAQLKARPDGRTRIRFADRAAYLAELVYDLARGQADQRWYHHEIEGLRSLPAGTAAREVFLREPALAPAILRALHAWRRLETVLSIWRPADGRRVLVACLEQRAPPGGPGPFEWPSSEVIHALMPSLLDVWPAVAPRPVRGRRADGGLNALRLYLALLTADAPEAGVESLGAVAELLLTLADGLHAVPEPLQLSRQLEHGRLGAAMEQLRSVDALHVIEAAPVLATLGDRVPQMARVVGPRSVRVPTRATRTAESAVFASRLGAAFLLLRELLWLCPELNGVQRAALLIRCLGEGEADDPALALIVGEDDAPACPHDHALDAALTRLRDAGRLDGRAIALVRLGPGHLVRDLLDDVWLALGDAGPWRAAAEHVEPAEPPSDLASRVERFRAHARPAADDLAALGVDGPPAERLLAHAVIRAFARRLVGFGWSSVDHLRANFLSGWSTIRPTSDGIEVELPQVPLQVVLRIAGVDGAEYDVPRIGRVTLRLARTR